jgi:hypothetical protein
VITALTIFPAADVIFLSNIIHGESFQENQKAHGQTQFYAQIRRQRYRQGPYSR